MKNEIGKLPRFFEIRETYTIDAFLGQGAFGSVYKVRHRYLGIQAIKIFHSGSIAVDKEAELFTEAFILSKIAHDNVVRVFEANTFRHNDQSYYYIATEYVNGPTLAQYIEGKVRLSVDEAFSLQKDICRGLAQAHNMSPPVVHRDVKPGNILLSNEGKKVSAKVADFGLARHVDSETKLITAGGTLAYMPPEAFWNYQSPASDVFSAGIIFYLMLAGVCPFIMPAETYTQKAQVEAAIKASRNKVPAPPSNFKPDLDKDIDAIVLKALAVNMQDRYQNCEEFLEAIKTYEEQFSSNLLEDINQAMHFGKQYATLSKAIEILERVISKQPSHKKAEMLAKYKDVLSGWKKGIMM